MTDIQKERHQDNLASMERMDRRIDALSEHINSVKNDTQHLDECFDRFQISFTAMSENFTMMYNALKIFHSPRKWAQDNWIVVGLIVVLVSFIPHLPNVLENVITMFSH